MAWSTPRTWTTGETVTAAHLNQEIRDNLLAMSPAGPVATSFVPALTAGVTNPVTGSGAVLTGRAVRYGQLITVWAIVQFGTSGASAGSGSYAISVPISISSDISSDTTIGTAMLLDSGTRRYVGLARRSSSGTVTILAENTGGVVTHNSPFAWGANDAIELQLAYQAA